MLRTNTSWRPTTMFVRRKEFKKHIATENTESTEQAGEFCDSGGKTESYFEIITREKMD